MSITYATEKTPIKLRSSYKELSVAQVQSMPNMSIREKGFSMVYNHFILGFYGYSTINHSYDLKSINGDIVVIDNATGLMWHQSGSDNYMVWRDAKEWIRSLNSRNYAGYNDWRLPTVEEAASLLESRMANDRYIDRVFSDEQTWIWIGDKWSEEEFVIGFDDFVREGAWTLFFGYGSLWKGVIKTADAEGGYHVRPVRSLK